MQSEPRPARTRDSLLAICTPLGRGVLGGTLALFLSLAALTPGAAGFGTPPYKGRQIEHERITRGALGCLDGPNERGCFDSLTMDQLAGSLGSYGYVDWPDLFAMNDYRAHCDDADYLTPGNHDGPYPYPHRPGLSPREAATGALFDCIKKLRGAFGYALKNAESVLYSDRDVIVPHETDIGAFCSQRSKCKALLGFGIALHGVQDFHSHSNWNDERGDGEISTKNPPGLEKPYMSLPAFLDLRGTSTSFVLPSSLAKLTTGCFDSHDVNENEPEYCEGRIRHLNLNKDRGKIDLPLHAGAMPAAYGADTARGRIGTNFQKAVHGAVADTRRQWEDLRAALVKPKADGGYGPMRGNLIACALERDDPVNECQGRDVAIVIDSSSSNGWTDPSNLRIAAGKQLNGQLVTASEAAMPGGKPDRSAVIDFDSSAQVVSPLADPSQADFSSIDSSGGTNIGSGVDLAIDELTRDGNPVRDRVAIAVLTDGEDGAPAALVTALKRARRLGIRVEFGFLSPPTLPASAKRLHAAQAASQPREVQAAILATGGVFATIDSAEAQRAFIDLVTRTGLTNLNDPNGADDDGGLGRDLTVTARLSGPTDVDRFTYQAPAGRRLTVKVRPLDGQKLLLKASSVEDLRHLPRANRHETGTLTITASTRRAGSVDFEVSGQGRAAGLFEIGLAQAGVDVIGSNKRDRLKCPPGRGLARAPAAHVLALGDRDHVSCGSGHDVIVGGPGADSLAGGAGDDTFLVGRADVPNGAERIEGGAGRDIVEVDVPRPKLRRGPHGETVVPLGRGKLLLRGVESITFAGAPNESVAAPSPKPTRDDVKAFLRKYTKRYEAEDASGLGKLFTRDAVRVSDGDHESRAQAIATYRKQFANLRNPKYTLSVVRIKTRQLGATVRARYRISSNKGTVRGNIKYTLVERNGELLIKRLDVKSD